MLKDSFLDSIANMKTKRLTRPNQSLYVQRGRRLGSSRQPFGYGLIGPLYHRGKVLIMCADTFGLMADSFER